MSVRAVCPHHLIEGSFLLVDSHGQRHECPHCKPKPKQCVHVWDLEADDRLPGMWTYFCRHCRVEKP